MNLFTRRELAARYRQSVRTIDNWKRSFLPSIKVGGKILFDVEQCDAAVRAFARRPRLAQQIPTSDDQKGVQ
jgi:hypothetical protein